MFRLGILQAMSLVLAFPGHGCGVVRSSSACVTAACLSAGVASRANVSLAPRRLQDRLTCCLRFCAVCRDLEGYIHLPDIAAELPDVLRGTR